MARSTYRYSLKFAVRADISPAVQQLNALKGHLERLGAGPGGTAQRVRAETAQTAAVAGTTKALQDKQKASEGLFATMRRGMGVYFSLMGALYAVRMAIGAVVNAYRMLWTVVQKGIGIMLGLGKAVLQNAADFETLRMKMQAIAPTADAGSRAFEKLKRWVIGMPFTLKEAADAYTYLEATGVRAAMGLFRSMRVTATMAKVMDRDLKSASLAVAKFAAGSMQRLTRGFAITGSMLLPYGATPGAVPGTLGQQTAKDRARNVDALFRFVETRWGTVLDRLRNTWVQLVNDMTDIWQQFMDGIGQAGLLDSMKNLLRYFRDMYELLRDDKVIRTWTKAIASAWKPIVDSVGPWMEKLPGLMQTLVGYTVKLGERTDAWLTSMGGVEGLWTRITNTITTTGPQVLTILRAYFNMMTGIGQAMTTLAGAQVLMSPHAYIPLLGGVKEWKAVWRGMAAATTAQGRLRKTVGSGIGTLIDDLSALNLSGGTMGLPGFKPYDWSATGGGEAQAAMKALTNMDEAVKTGAKEGVKEGLEAVFSKSAIAEGGVFVRLYEAMRRQVGGGVPAVPAVPGARSLQRLQDRMAAAPGYRAGGNTRSELSFKPLKTLLERGLTVGPPGADVGTLTTMYTAAGLMGALPKLYNPGLAFIGEELSRRKRGAGRQLAAPVMGPAAPLATGISIHNSIQTYIGGKQIRDEAQEAVIDVQRRPAINYGRP